MSESSPKSSCPFQIVSDGTVPVAVTHTHVSTAEDQWEESRCLAWKEESSRQNGAYRVPVIYKDGISLTLRLWNLNKGQLFPVRAEK